MERVLGRYHHEVNGKIVEVKDCSYDIPLLESLQCLLKTNIVRDQVCSALEYSGTSEKGQIENLSTQRPFSHA